MEYTAFELLFLWGGIFMFIVLFIIIASAFTFLYFIISNWPLDKFWTRVIFVYVMLAGSVAFSAVALKKT